MCTGRPIDLLIFCRILTVARCLRASGGAIFESTESRCRLVDELQPVIVHTVLFSWVSTFFEYALLSQTRVQYSAILYIKTRADMWRTFAWYAQLVPTNLLIVFQRPFQMIPLELIVPRRSHTYIYVTRYLWCPLCRH